MPLSPSKGASDSTTRRHNLFIYLFILAGIIFRSELVLLLATQLLYLLVVPLMSLETIISVGLRSAVVALLISVPIDSYFWQRPIWPELAGFFYNAIQGKSADWGTSPFHAYFTSFLPKLLLNPAIYVFLIPAAFYFPATRRPAIGLVVPCWAFIAIYSLQPHKEARFIIYTVPPLTACAALSANYIFTRRSRSLMNRLLSLLIMLSIICSFAASIVMLGISSLNYPGGEALYRLHEIVASNDPKRGTVNVQMDVLACMTGVSRFQQDFPTPPLSHYLSLLNLSSNITSASRQKGISSPARFRYDKTEEPDTLVNPAFWTRFDYALAEHPEKVIGKWEIIDTIYGYSGIEFLWPGAISSSGVDSSHEAVKAWEEMGEHAESSGNEAGDGKAKVAKDMTILEKFFNEIEELGFYGAVREGTRKWITKGWWVGPKLGVKIRIMKRVP